MPFTISESFERFRSKLEITEDQTSIVSTRQQAVRCAMERGFKVVDAFFLTGSYRRHTMISPWREADVDVFVCLGRPCRSRRSGRRPRAGRWSVSSKPQIYLLPYQSAN
ncbi:SMODS domain-containing nucleotidyltransferase [Bradyrhizobium genosp. A]|uniref:SMODS domain-containing nucleotidyltransferase n=1 Tax=Bradyrhizobium genosp. A TaxID=83626 RepID=UPI003CF68A58